MLYRQIILEWGQDTESGVWGLGYSPDNGKNFYVLNTTHGRKYRAEDGNRLYPYISDQVQDKIETVVAPAKSAADSAVAYANDAIEKSRVNSQAIDDINSAVSDAVSDAAVARSDGLRAWDAAQSNVNLIDLNYASASASISSARTEAIAAANEAKASASAAQADIVAVRSDVATVQAEVTNFGPSLKSAQSDAGKALTQIADTASALSETKAALTSDVAVAKNLANTAQTTANSAIESASSVANDLAAVASQAKANANGITKVTSDVGLLQTTVADNSGNISTIQETTKQIQQAVSDNSGNITVAKQTADSAVTVASDASSNATVAIQTASQASITANNASGQAASAVLTANGAMTTASNAKSDATVAIQTASGASLTATNANSDATVAKQTASEAKVQASNAESDFAQLSIRANKIEANVATNSGAIASVQQTANGLTTTVADIKANGGGRNLLQGTRDFSGDWLYLDRWTKTGDTYHGLSVIETNVDWFGAAEFSPVKKGETYTFSLFARYTSGTGSSTIYVRLDSDPENGFTLAQTNPTHSAFYLDTNWKKCSITFTATTDGYIKPRMERSNDNTNTLQVCGFMLEKGTVAHDWSPAPDDVQNQFTQINESINGITTIINDPKTGLNATYQTAAGNATTISNAQGDIAKLKTRADGFDAEFATANGNISKLQTDATGTTQTLANTKSDVAVLQSRADGLDAKYADAAGNINTLKANASGFSQTLVSAKGDISTLQSTATGLKNTLTDAQGNISTLQSDVSGLKKTTSDNAGNIATLQASAQTLTNQMSSAQGDISTLKQTASGFSSKVSGMETSLADANSKIDGITSNGGGTNLLKGTAKFGSSFKTNNGTQTIQKYDDETNYIQYASNTPISGLGTYWGIFVPEVGQVYTLSADVYGNGFINGGSSFHYEGGDNGNLGQVNLTNDWQRISNTFRINRNSGWVNWVIYASQSTLLKIKRIKVEKGTVAHDWSPAPEDTDAKITANTTAIEQNKKAITLKADQTTVDKTNGDVQQLQSQLKVQAGQIASKVSSSDLDAKGYATQTYTQTQIKQTADSWNANLTSVKDGLTQSYTNLHATVDGIQAQVYNSDGSSKITQLSSLIATKVSSGDYNSQIAQLKDAINLRVAKGDVISQINQEAGGDTLIQVSNGKKSLILDANNTIVTGKAWIPDAAISSISADKIMLGSSALYNSDGTLNLVNERGNLKALIQVKQGLVQDTTQSIISFSSDYNNRAFSVTPVGATITPTLFFERYDQTAGHWLGFTRNEVRRDGLMFHTWDDEGERFFVGCHARFDRNISVDGTISQGTWNGTSGKPEAGILTIKSGNTIWSGSDFLAIGDHISNSFTNVMARSFSQQSTLSSKTNIETVDPKYALDLVNRTDILSYQYKADVAQGKTKRYTSMILDDVNDVSKYYAPDEFANEERTGRDDGSAVGYLFLAVQELTRRIKNLEEKLHE